MSPLFHSFRLLCFHKFPIATSPTVVVPSTRILVMVPMKTSFRVKEQNAACGRTTQHQRRNRRNHQRSCSRRSPPTRVCHPHNAASEDNATSEGNTARKVGVGKVSNRGEKVVVGRGS